VTHRLIALTLLVAVLAALAPVGALAQQPNRGITIPVTGTFTNTTTGETVNNASLTISRFVAQGNQLFATGTLLIPFASATVLRVVSIPVDLATSAGTCQILNLVLGPLHLDLLGLVIDLKQVVLNITAEAGAGNLLGNLLCAIAGLLNPGGALNQLINALNQLLAILG
jgi:hypothetical protein